MIAILEMRPKGAETIVLACENAPREAYERVRETAVATGALMLRTVVNRMCVALDREARGSERRRIVSVHPLREWLVEQPGEDRQSALLEALSIVEGFEVVNDIQARHDRKLWMVNGGHQTLALAARRGGGEHRLASAFDDDLRSALSEHVEERLGELHAAMDAALSRAHPDLEGNRQYGKRHVKAYSEHEDSVARVLGAFRRMDLVPFIEAIDERIAAPARVCHDAGLSVAPFAG